MKVIGITGPTGAGKTTALNVLRSMGAEVVDADAVYHRLLLECEALKTRLIGSFGENILDREGKIDRKRLARAVYPDRLEELNALTHPYVVEAVETKLAAVKSMDRPILAIDAIALVESGLAHRCDRVVAVLAPKELRLRRIMVRDGIGETYARRRIEAQKPDDFYRECSDQVLENGEGDTPEEFQKRALKLFQEILA